MKRRLVALALTAGLLLALFLGCSASNKEAVASDMMYEYSSGTSETPAAAPSAPAESYTQADTNGGMQLTAADAEMPKSEEASGGGFLPDANRKIIRSAWLDLETTQFDESIQQLSALVSEYKGYIEQSDVSGKSIYGGGTRYASYTLRIPSDALDAFLQSTGSVGNVIQEGQSAQEVTEQYFDAEAHLETLRVQEQRLLAILEKSAELTDIIQLEQALADTRYQIESYTGTLKKYDSLIAYSTVTVSINEVYEITPVNEMPKSLSERISQRFSNTMSYLKSEGENFLVWLLGESPIILINLLWLAVAALVIWLLVRRVVRRRARKAAANTALKADADEDQSGEAPHEK